MARYVVFGMFLLCDVFIDELVQNRGRPGIDHNLDHNVKAAWDMGYTGKGIVVTILDDGLERTHPDIMPNYVSTAFE
jgi:subtilisin family serine protease